MGTCWFTLVRSSVPSRTKYILSTVNRSHSITLITKVIDTTSITYQPLWLCCWRGDISSIFVHNKLDHSSYYVSPHGELGTFWFTLVRSSVPSKHETLTQAGPMLAHRLRRWPSIKPTLVQRFVFAGSQSVSLCWESSVL